MSIILHQVSKMDTFTFIVNGLPFFYFSLIRLSSSYRQSPTSSSSPFLSFFFFSSHGNNNTNFLEIVEQRHETPLFRYFYYFFFIIIYLLLLTWVGKGIEGQLRSLIVLVLHLIRYHPAAHEDPRLANDDGTDLRRYVTFRIRFESRFSMDFDSPRLLVH